MKKAKLKNLFTEVAHNVILASETSPESFNYYDILNSGQAGITVFSYSDAV